LEMLTAGFILVVRQIKKPPGDLSAPESLLNYFRKDLDLSGSYSTLAKANREEILLQLSRTPNYCQANLNDLYNL